MTAMKDALQKAGLDTAAIELQKLAADAIRMHGGSAADAAPKFVELVRKRADLLDVLVRDYLLRIAGEMKVVGDPISFPERPRDVKVSGMTVSKHHRKGFVRHRRRTASEKAAATRAAVLMSAAARSVYDEIYFDGRSIREVSWGELGLLAHSCAANLASYLMQGTAEAVRALIAIKVHNHSQVSDHRTLVPDIVSEDQLKQIRQEARDEAPLLVKLAQHHVKNTILQPPPQTIEMSQ